MTISLEQAIALGEFISKQTYFLWIAALALTLVELNMIRHASGEHIPPNRKKQADRFVCSCISSIVCFSLSLIVGFVVNLTVVSLVEFATTQKANEQFGLVEVLFVIQALMFGLGLAIFITVSILNPRALTVAITNIAGWRG